MAPRIGSLHAYTYCGLVDEALIDRDVVLCGWVDTRRDHGGVIFIDMRDHEGIVQVVIEPDNKLAFASAEHVRYEYCLRIAGKVRPRPPTQINERLRTGKIEVVASTVEVLNAAAPLPFMLDDNVGEDARLRYRYLDMRRPDMQRKMRMRTKLVSALRHYLDVRGFQDIETPILTKATPEGARDYLVPSRVHPGEFYALPQSPQLYKQLLMVSGFDRYFQIARCFRDEDLRRTGSPSSPSSTWIRVRRRARGTGHRRGDDPPGVQGSCRRGAGRSIPAHHVRRSDAPLRFGQAGPAHLALGTGGYCRQTQASNSRCSAAPPAIGRPRRGATPARWRQAAAQISGRSRRACCKYGAKGLAWIRIDDLANGRDGMTSPILKFLDDAALDGVLKAVGAQTGDVIFFGAGPYKTVSDFMGALRIKIARDNGLVEDTWKPLWVTDFPMFEYDHDAKRHVALHHPFTAPKVDDIADLKANAHTAVSRGYDCVLNGNEIGGGSIRIHRPEMQSAVFELLGIGAEEAQAKFGFLLDALRTRSSTWRIARHDRIAALMAGTESIRDVIAFPKTASAQDSMTSAPSNVPEAQLQSARARGEAAKSVTRAADERPRHTLHGLWMRTLAALRRRIEDAGFSVELFDYASVTQTRRQHRPFDRARARRAGAAGSFCRTQPGWVDRAAGAAARTGADGWACGVSWCAIARQCRCARCGTLAWWAVRHRQASGHSLQGHRALGREAIRWRRRRAFAIRLWRGCRRAGCAARRDGERGGD